MLSPFIFQRTGNRLDVGSEKWRGFAARMSNFSLFFLRGPVRVEISVTWKSCDLYAASLVFRAPCDPVVRVSKVVHSDSYLDC